VRVDTASPADGSLLLTADDFGLCRPVNEAVCLLHDRGVLHSTSLLANTELFEASAGQLRARPSLRAGLHLNLTDGRPVLAPTRVPSLVNARGAFHGGRHYRVLAHVLAGRFRLDEVRAEWRAQAARLSAAGIRIQHLNSHGHFHLLPPYRSIVLELVQEFAIPFVRLLLSVDSLRHRPFERCSRALRDEMDRRGVRVTYPRRVVGLAGQGALDEAFFRERLAAAGDELTEIIVHPSAAGNAYHRLWRYAGEAETGALLSAEVVSLARRRARSAVADAASA
jgi:predicted glycoside hydrolase/deacetylase ChbG (UPF0249 family)